MVTLTDEVLIATICTGVPWTPLIMLWTRQTRSDVCVYAEHSGVRRSTMCICVVLCCLYVAASLRSRIIMLPGIATTYMHSWTSEICCVLTCVRCSRHLEYTRRTLSLVYAVLASQEHILCSRNSFEVCLVVLIPATFFSQSLADPLRKLPALFV